MPLTDSFLSRAILNLAEEVRKRNPLPYAQYELATRALGRPVLNCLDTRRMQPEEIANVSRLAYAVHCLYTRFDLTSSLSLVIGYPSSLDFRARYPGEYVTQELEDLTQRYVDKGYKLSENQDRSRARMQAFLEADATQLFLAGELSEAGGYYLLVTLASICGGRFNTLAYQTCFEILLQSLSKHNFGGTWRRSQTNLFIELTSYLLPAKKQSLYSQMLNQQFENLQKESGTDVAQLCHNLFTSLLEENS